MKRSINSTCITVLLLTIPAMIQAGELYDPPKTPGLAGFPTMETIGMDGSESSITIPKTWKLISVSNGIKANSNNLWFQDKDGTVYMIDGYMTGGPFILTGVIHKLIAR